MTTHPMPVAADNAGFQLSERGVLTSAVSAHLMANNTEFNLITNAKQT